MRFFITYDANAEANLDDFLDLIVDLGFRKYFDEKCYNDSCINICVVLMCRDPRLKFKQRIRFSKKDNTLYMDIMLNLDEVKLMDPVIKRKFISEKLVKEVLQIVAKYKFKDFDLKRFSNDLRDWFEQHGWLPSIEESFSYDN